MNLWVCAKFFYLQLFIFIRKHYFGVLRGSDRTLKARWLQIASGAHDSRPLGIANWAAAADADGCRTDALRAIAN